ncbi:MAG TPA: YceI family protein [Terracidiphilus sp.]
MAVKCDRPFRKSDGCKYCLWGASLVLAVSSFFTVSASAQNYRVDTSASTVRFTLGGSHTVVGTFKVSSGDFSLDPQSGAMKGMVTVDASSGNSDDKGRDKKMTNDQMKAQNFPSITFAPAKFSGQVKDSGDSTGQVDGTFTLLGQGHALSVPMTVHVEGDHFTATGSFMVPYVSWGMKDPSWFVMKEAKEVKVDLKLAGTVSK